MKSSPVQARGASAPRVSPGDGASHHQNQIFFIGPLLSALKEASRSKNQVIGRELHAVALKSGGFLNLCLACSLIDMYSKCGLMREAQIVFDQMPVVDVASWNALIQAFAANGDGGRGLRLLRVMLESGLDPNSRTFVGLIKACVSLADSEEVDREKLVKVRSLELGMALHSEAFSRGCDSIFVSSCLVDLYAKCGSLDDARRVFDSMPERNMVAWTSIMIGYADAGDGETALELFSAMDSQGVSLDARCFVAAFKACASLASKEEGVEFVDGARVLKPRSLEIGLALHAHASSSRFGFQRDVFVAAAIVRVYSKCGLMEAAREVFDRFASRDVVAWTALMLGYADNGEHEAAIEVFMSRASRGLAASTRTYVAVLKACSRLADDEAGCELDDRVVKVKALSVGMGLHAEISRSGADEADIFVGNTLIDMYAKCGSMPDSRRVFDSMLTVDVVSWNTLILGFAENGEPEAALELFVEMQGGGFVPDELTFLAAVKACSFLAAKERLSRNPELGSRLMKPSSLERGMALHAESSRLRLDEDQMVASSLVDLYLRCGSTEDAHRTFDRISSPDRIAWTILVCGYAENGDGDAALHLFSCMKSRGFAPDSSTYVALLKACGVAGDFATGRVLHWEICRAGLDNHKVLITSLIDFYGKCGKMAGAQVVVDSSSEIDVVSWTSLVAGYGRKGSTGLMFEMFSKMVESGVKPAGITFLCVLAACSHAGLVEKGRRCFEEMQEKYGIKAEREHYHCVIDLLGRADRLGEALAMVELMPYKPNSITWITLLSSCRHWSNAGVGSFAFDSLTKEMAEKDVKSSAYLLMANMYES